MLIAEDIQVEWDEGGCYLLVDGERWLVAEPEQLYDRVKAAILPWLMERDEAFQEFRQYAERGTGPAAAYFACKDPEGDWIADQRAVAIREDGSLRIEPDEEPDDWRERLADNADWSRKAERENR